MLTIRAAQFAALTQSFEAHTEARALRHLRASIPDVCAGQSDEALRETVRRALQRARRHGFEAEYDLFRYLNVMLMFGPDFDVDPALPWAAATLEGTKLRDRPAVDCDREALTALGAAQDGADVVAKLPLRYADHGATVADRLREAKRSQC